MNVSKYKKAIQQQQQQKVYILSIEEHMASQLLANIGQVGHGRIQWVLGKPGTYTTRKHAKL